MISNSRRREMEDDSKKAATAEPIFPHSRNCKPITPVNDLHGRWEPGGSRVIVNSLIA